jgi:hypothetical protein
MVTLGFSPPLEEQKKTFHSDVNQTRRVRAEFEVPGHVNRGLRHSTICQVCKATNGARPGEVVKWNGC